MLRDFFVAGIVGLIVYFIYDFLIKRVNNNSASKSSTSSAPNPEPTPKVNDAPPVSNPPQDKFVTFIQKIYMVTFTPEQITEISNSADQYRCAAKYLPRHISLSGFLNNVTKYCYNQLRNFGVSGSDLNTYLSNIKSQVEEITEKNLRIILDYQDSLLPDQMSFLRGTINYDSITLNFLMNCADNFGDKDLEKKIFDYMELLGYSKIESSQETEPDFLNKFKKDKLITAFIDLTSSVFDSFNTNTTYSSIAQNDFMTADCTLLFLFIRYLDLTKLGLSHETLDLFIDTMYTSLTVFFSKVFDVETSLAVNFVCDRLSNYDKIMSGDGDDKSGGLFHYAVNLLFYDKDAEDLESIIHDGRPTGNILSTVYYLDDLIHATDDVGFQTEDDFCNFFDQLKAMD